MDYLCSQLLLDQCFGCHLLCPQSSDCPVSLAPLLELGFLDLDLCLEALCCAGVLLELLAFGFLDLDLGSSFLCEVLAAAYGKAKSLSKCCTRASSKVDLKRKDEFNSSSGPLRRR